MNFVIVHFNTPELTSCLCSSIKKNHPDARIIIFDNSNKRPFIYKDILCDEYFDNTHSQLIDFEQEFKQYNIVEKVYKLNKCGSAKHCRTIQWLFDNLKLKEFILLDSDVLLIKPFDFIDKNFSCIATYEQFKGMKDRLLPFVCYFNFEKLKGINYFDANRMNGLSIAGEMYDTGASFTEDLIKNNKLYKNINYKDYLVHYRAGSWDSINHSKNDEYKNWLKFYEKYWK